MNAWNLTSVNEFADGTGLKAKPTGYFGDSQQSHLILLRMMIVFTQRGRRNRGGINLQNQVQRDGAWNWLRLVLARIKAKRQLSLASMILESESSGTRAHGLKCFSLVAGRATLDVTIQSEGGEWEILLGWSSSISKNATSRCQEYTLDRGRSFPEFLGNCLECVARFGEVKYLKLEIYFIKTPPSSRPIRQGFTEFCFDCPHE